jgi:hypothetical protein
MTRLSQLTSASCLALGALCAACGSPSGAGKEDGATPVAAKGDAAVPSPSADAFVEAGGAAAPLLLEDWEEPSGHFLWQRVVPGRGAVTPLPLPGSPIEPPRGTSRRALHVSDLSTSDGLEIRGHGHLPIPGDATIVFWARSALGNPERLLFAAGGGALGDQGAAWSQQEVWLGRELIVPTRWTEFRLPVRDLSPVNPGAPVAGLEGHTVMLRFVTHPETFDFWIDDIKVERESPGTR